MLCLLAVSERIYKLQPNRSMYLRGFSGIDSPASMHSASATGFTISGVFRDPAAFWVLVLFDVDDFYNHPRIKPLPDGNLKGLVLDFDVQFTGLAALDTPKYPAIDFPFLNFIRMDGTAGRVDISYANTQTAIGGTSTNTLANAIPTSVRSGSHTAASATISVATNGPIAGDVLTLWWENYAYSYTMRGDDSAPTVAAALAAISTPAPTAATYMDSARRRVERTLKSPRRGQDPTAICFASIGWRRIPGERTFR